MFGRIAAFAVAVFLLAAPTAVAATRDTATAEASPGPYLVDAPITFTSTTPCTVACRLTWTYLNGTRLGDALGEGVSVVTAFTAPGLKTVELRLSEPCVGSPRLTCASFAYVSVFVQAAQTPEDTTPPTFAVSGLSAEATGPSTVVDYTFSASDPDDAVASQSCTPAPGSSFSVGSTPIDCTATDTHGNVDHETFQVIVSDTTPPTVSAPAARTVEATSASGASVEFGAASATDLVDGPVPASCSPASGSTFALGTTTVECTATDAHGNSGSAGFDVTVADTTAPTVTVPGRMTVEATSAAGAVVTYTATASDLVDGALAPTCSRPSGSTFPLGSTTVDCTATDAHGNSGTASFDVVVADTRGPTLTVPGPITVDATSPAGAVVTYAASASDALDGAVTPSCSPPSGAVFAIGTTTVTCTARDSQGNASPAQSFTVRVKGALEQLQDVRQEVAALGLKGNRLVSRLDSVINAVARSSPKSCRLLADLIHDLDGPLGKDLTPAQLTSLRADLGRVSSVLGC